MTDFSGLSVVVTGGASGIGAATCATLVERGARVAVFDRNASAVPADMLAIECDITDPSAIADAIRRVVEGEGGIDVLVNNAGRGAVGDVAANTAEEWHEVLDLNVVAMASVSAAALPYLRASRSAAIVNVCSAVAFVGVRQRALYSATKGAVAALTLAMAVDHVGDGIRVNAVAPGTVDTPWIDRLLAETHDSSAAAAALAQRQPTGRLVSPQEVAGGIAYLASPLSGSTTGTVLHIDGGMTSLRT